MAILIALAFSFIAGYVLRSIIGFRNDVKKKVNEIYKEKELLTEKE